jgi:nitric oxide dioxygenase
MDPRQIQLVQESFAKVLPIADLAAAMFYNRLFETAPELKSLFKGDMQQQGKRLMSMIGVAVRKLNDLPGLAPALHDLGRRHVGYKVKPEDYAKVGGALLWTLEQGLGAAFTDEVKRAWTAVYGVLADSMVSAAEGPTLRSSGKAFASK